MPDDITVTPKPATLRLAAFAPTILLKSNVWYNWAQIAITHEAESLASREDWHTGRHQNILPEFHASLVTAVAVAFFFDALHAEIAPLLKREADRRGWGYMRETFAVACSPPNGWQPDFEWLFRELRPHAVHSRPEQHEPLWHDALKTNLARENHDFSTESCTRAVDLMMGILGALFAGERAVDPAVRQWSADRRHILNELEKLRDASQGRASGKQGRPSV